MDSSTKIWPIFRWANWWISDDLFTGIQNSYYYSNLLEVREDAKSVFPWASPAIAWDATCIALWSDTDKPVAIVQTSISTEIIVCVGKNVFSVDMTNETQYLLTSFPNDICDAEAFNWYIYISTTWGVYMISESANTSDWQSLWSSVSVTSVEPYLWKLYSFSTNIVRHPLYASDILMCIWDWDELLKVERETCNLAQTAIKLQKWFSVKLLAELWWFIRIVASDWMWGSQLLMWDKVSEAPNEVLPFGWYIFFQTAIYWWYQYLLSDKWLWVVNGYQFYILKKAQEWDIQSSAYNSMCVYYDKLYFCTSEWIYIYWAKNKNYNDVLSLWMAVKNCWCIYTDWINLYTTTWKRSSDGVEYSVVGMDNTTIDWQPRNTSIEWELQTMCYFWSSLSEIKQSLYLRVGYKIPSDWTRTWNIHIYYRTDADATTNNSSDWEWHELTQPWGLVASSDMRSPFATSLKLNCRFQWIQFKFVIKNCALANGNYLYTHLYSADLYYNDMLD
jgi:hypothetical protein